MDEQFLREWLADQIFSTTQKQQLRHGEDAMVEKGKREAYQEILRLLTMREGIKNEWNV